MLNTLASLDPSSKILRSIGNMANLISSFNAILTLNDGFSFHSTKRFFFLLSFLMANCRILKLFLALCWCWFNVLIYFVQPLYFIKRKGEEKKSIFSLVFLKITSRMLIILSGIYLMFCLRMQEMKMYMIVSTYFEISSNVN